MPCVGARLRAIRGCDVHPTLVISPASGLLPRRPYPILVRLNSCPFAVKLPGVPAIAGAAQAVVSPRAIAIAPAGKA